MSLTLKARLAAATAVLFDLDGTLADTIPLIHHTFKHILKTELDLDVNSDDIRRFCSHPLAHTLQSLEPNDDKRAKISDNFINYSLSLHDDWVKLYPGTEETLDTLNKFTKLGIVTSKRNISASRTVQLFSLKRWMDVIITADDVEHHKPDPEPLLKACKFINVSASNSIYIGDAPSDIVAARNAGSISVGALWGAFTREEIIAENPDFLLESIDELPLLFTDKYSNYLLNPDSKSAI